MQNENLNNAECGMIKSNAECGMRSAEWKIKAILVVLALFVPICAAADDKTFIDRIFFEDFIDFGRTIAEDPLKSSIIAGSVILGGALVFAFDDSIAAEMKKTNDFNDIVFNTANYLGDGAYVLAADAFLFLGGAREKKAAQLVIESILVSGAISQALKLGFGRSRPSATEGPYMFRPFSDFDLSFPSGHACVAFSWATILGDTYDIGWLTYPVAGLVAWARVYKNAHWPSDVLVGGVLGLVTAKILKASRDMEERDVQLEIRYSELNTPVFGVSIGL